MASPPESLGGAKRGAKQSRSNKDARQKGEFKTIAARPWRKSSKILGVVCNNRFYNDWVDFCNSTSRAFGSTTLLLVADFVEPRLAVLELMWFSLYEIRKRNVSSVLIVHVRENR